LLAILISQSEIYFAAKTLSGKELSINSLTHRLLSLGVSHDNLDNLEIFSALNARAFFD
jgi:hypothetical protein